MKNENVKQQSKNSGIKKLILKTLLLLSPAIVYGVFALFVHIFIYENLAILQVLFNLAVPLMIITAIYTLANIIVRLKPNFGFTVGFLIFFLILCVGGILWFSFYALAGIGFYFGVPFGQIIFYIISLLLYIGATVYLTKEICSEVKKIKAESDGVQDDG